MTMRDPDLQRRRRSGSIWLLGIGAIASIWVAFATYVYFDRKHQIEEAWQSSSTLAGLLAAQVDRTIANADSLLRFLQLQLKQQPDADPFVAARSLDLLLDAYVQSSVVDAEGTPRWTMNPPSVRLPRHGVLASFDWVPATKAMQSDQLFIGRPEKSTGQKWFSAIARPIVVNGTSQGSVVVGLDPFWFARFFDRVALGPHDSVQLLYLDGRLLSRTLLTEDMLRDTHRHPGAALGELAQGGRGRIETTDPIDGLDKLISVRKLENFPLGISVAYPRDQVMAPANERARLLGAAATALSLLLLAACIRMDRNDRKRAELLTALENESALLQQVQRHLGDMIETMADGVVLWNKDGQFVLCNTSYRRLLDPASEVLRPGITFDAWRAHADASGLVDGGAPAVLHDWITIRREVERSAQKELAYEAHLASGIWLLVRRTQTSDGGTLTLCTDITALKAREIDLSESHDLLQAQSEELAILVREIEAAKRETDRAYEARGLLLTHISHELRTPMTSVIGFARLMQAEMFGPLGDARYLDFANRIVANGEHQVAIIGDVLDLARAEAGRLVLVETEVPVDDLTDWVVAQMQPLADANKILLQRATVPGLRIFGDEKRLRQMLLNLVGNAIKFAPGGLVAIEVQMAPDGGVVFTVRDTGRGIDPADLAHVMELFGQARDGVGGALGTGVGLPLVRRLAEAHGGRFELASEGIGTGTSARIHLPAVRAIVEQRAHA